MNVIARIKQAVLSRVITASMPNGVMEFQKRLGKDPEVSQEALVRRYWGWTYACINASSSRFASTPLKVYATRGVGQNSVKNFRSKKVDKEQTRWLKQRIGKSLPQVAGAEDFEELEEHPILDILQNANDQENGYELKELTNTMLDLTGNAYWLIERDKLGVPTKFFVLRSQWVRIQPDEKNFISGYLYGYNNMFSSSSMTSLAPEEVIHFKYPNPNDPWYGAGPTQSVAFAIENCKLREQFMLSTLGNMARPDLIVKYTEGELDSADRAAVEREWNAMFRGAKNAGKVKVTDHRYEIEKVGWNPSELRFNEGEEWVLKKICAAFPVPLGLIDSSYISRAPRAGLEGSDLFMAQLNTLPRCTRFEEKLNEQLCPMYDDRLFVAFDNPVPKDRVLQNSEDVQRLNTYQITINEIRKREGEEEVEWGDVPMVGMGIAPLNLNPEPAPQPLPLGSIVAKPTAAGVAPIGQQSAHEMTDSELSGGAISEEQVKEAVKGMVGEGMTLEVEGQYVHPDLVGVPIKIRVRNEGGRFDKHDPDKVRATRGAVRLLRP